MGAFFVNFHVRCDARDAVQQAVSAIGASRFRVSDPHQGWVSVYEQRASTQEEDWIKSLALALSSRLQTACVAFLVHDSDIACYWLNEQGKLLDEYNSAPDYFEPVAAAEKRRVRGQADVFLRFCQPSVTREQIEEVLRREVTFAEDIVQTLAEFLGIDPEHALQDYGRGRGPGGFGEDDVDGAEDDADGSMPSGADTGNLMQTMQQQVARMLGTGEATSPQSDELVQAAASGNIAEIDRLVAAGADVNSQGLLTLEPFSGLTPLGKMGVAPKMTISPLMGAASKGQAAAAERLLELGAAKEIHPLWGSALHAAAQAGSPDTVRVLLAGGIPANVTNRMGLTPRALIEATRNQIELTRQMAKSMPQLKKVYEQMSANLEQSLPEAGWKACAELLSQAGG